MKPGTVIHYKGVDAIACSVKTVSQILTHIKEDPHTSWACSNCVFVKQNTSRNLCRFLQTGAELDCVGVVFLPIEHEAAVKTALVTAALKDAK